MEKQNLVLKSPFQPNSGGDTIYIGGSSLKGVNWKEREDYPRVVQHRVWFGPVTDAVLLFSPVWAFPVVTAVVNCPCAVGCVMQYDNSSQ